MSSTTTVETLAVPGAGGGGGSFPGYRNATISNTSTPVPPLAASSRPNTSKTRPRFISEMSVQGDPGTTAATPISRPISNSTSYYRGNDASSANINGNQTPLSPSPTKEMSRVTSILRVTTPVTTLENNNVRVDRRFQEIPIRYQDSYSPVKQRSPKKEQRSPSKTPSRAQSAMTRSQRGSYDESGPDGRSKSRLDYHGFEEYDGGRLSRVGRQTPAVMVPPGWPDPPEKKVEPLTLSTPQHKPRSVSAYGRRRGSVAGSHSVHDFKTVKNDGYAEQKENIYSRPTTQQYKSLKNLSEGHYAPSVDHNPTMSVYTPSAMEATSYNEKPPMSKSISYSNSLNKTAPAEDIIKAHKVETQAPAANVGRQDETQDNSSFAVRRMSNSNVGQGGRDPETGLFPSPTHAVRNQIGTNKNFTKSSYDISSAENYESNSGYMSPKKTASRPFTAAPARPMRSSRSMMNLARNAEPFDYGAPPEMASETTSKRAYRYDDEGFHKARTQPFKHDSQVRIAVEGKRYMAPEKKDVYVRFPDSHARQPFTPRHTPAYAFPPPGSDIRRHGAKDFIVNGSNFYNRNSSTQGMDTGYSRPSTGFESGMPMVYGHSISGGSESSGGSAGMGGKPFAFKTNTRGGTTMRSAHRDFGVLGEDFRPRTLRPWSSIRTGKEGTFDDRVTSREQYVYRQYVPPIVPNVRRETLKTADSEERSNSMTTYRRYIENEDVTLSPRKRVSRYDPSVVIPNKIDWM